MTRLILVLSLLLLGVVGTEIWLDVVRINELRADDPPRLRVMGKFAAWNKMYRRR